MIANGSDIERAAGLPPGNCSRPADLHEVDLARAQEYALLAALLLRAPDAGMLVRLARLGSGDASPLGRAHAKLAEAAQEARAGSVDREYFDLFIGVGRGELQPYGSYYLTGFLHERPLARLRDDLARMGIARAENRAEPEDHVGTLCEIMAGLVTGELGPPDTQARFFQTHVAPVAERFFTDLEQASAARFYRAVGALGRLFVAIETDAFTLPA